MHLIRNIGELVTLAPLTAKAKLTGITRRDLDCVTDAWLTIDSGKIHDYGDGRCPHAADTETDAQGRLVMPGLVDCHTHPIFAGSRANEFCQRLEGRTYQEIAAAGGGIKATVNSTRAASDDELLMLTSARLKRFLGHGVTTVEMKSGYGLSVADELRLLRVLKKAAAASPQTTQITCLGLHAVPPEATNKEQFIAAMTDELLPLVARESLAEWVDAFVEEGYFSPDEVDRHMTKAKELGLGIRIHADEFRDSGAAAAAAAWGATSADHLEEASDAGIRSMAEAGVVAVLLPGTSLYCAMKYTDARRFRKHGCEIALATDFNPGSCVLDNLAQVATLGALHCHLLPAEAVAAVTIVAAKALGLHRSKGALARGYDADLNICGVSSIDDWVADFGRHSPKLTMIGGKAVHTEVTH